MKQIFIKTIDDLPTEAGSYIAKRKTKDHPSLHLYKGKDYNELWLRTMDWYITPPDKEPQEPKQTAEEILNGLGNIITGIQSDIDFNEKVNIGLVMDGLTVIMEQVERYVQNQQPGDEDVNVKFPAGKITHKGILKKNQQPGMSDSDEDYRKHGRPT